MNIVISTHYFHPHTGGIETVAHQHARRLADRGHDVAVVSSKLRTEPRREARDGYTIYRYDALNPFEKYGLPYPIPNPVDFRKTFEQVEDDSVHVYHFHGINYPSTSLAHLFSDSTTPVLVHQHTPFIDYPFPWWVAEYLNDRVVGRVNVSNADVTLCVSETIAEYVARIDSTASPTVFHNGVDTDRFDPERTSDSLPGVSRNEPTFLSINRLSSKKGIESVVRAARILEQRGVPGQLLLAGSGAETDRIKRISNRRSNVTSIGYIPEERLPSYYASSTAFIFTSTSGEAFPTLTMLEAMSSGTPVIASRVDDGVEAITRENSRLVTPGNAFELADAMEELATNPEIAVELGKRARKTVEREFDIEDRVTALETIYHDVQP